MLSIWLTDSLGAMTNHYLIEKLCEIGAEVDEIVGSPISLELCPCFRYRTIGKRGCYEICKVCWWEDDGQDNKTVDIVVGGPNYHLSLTQARINFITKGISNSTREDLMKIKHSARRYEKGRVFELFPEKNAVIEPESGSTSNSE